MSATLMNIARVTREYLMSFIRDEMSFIKICSVSFFIPVLIFLCTLGNNNKKHCVLKLKTLREVHNFIKRLNQTSQVQLVLDCIEKYGIDVNEIKQKMELSLFHCACISGNTELLKELVKLGADVNKETIHGDSPTYLLIASKVQGKEDYDLTSLDALNFLINSGADLNHQNSRGFTCLHRCASYGVIELTKYLLQKGAKASIKNKFGMLPDKCAMMKGHMELMDILKAACDNGEYRPVYDEGSWVVSPEYIQAKVVDHKIFRNRRQILKDVQNFDGAGDLMHNQSAGILHTPGTRRANDLANLTLEDSRFVNLTARSEENLHSQSDIEKSVEFAEI